MNPDPQTLADLRIHWRRLVDAVDALLGVDPATPCDCCGEPVGENPVQYEETILMCRNCEANRLARQPLPCGGTSESMQRSGSVCPACLGQRGTAPCVLCKGTGEAR